MSEEPVQTRVWNEFDDGIAALLHFYLSPDAPGLELTGEDYMPEIDVEAARPARPTDKEPWPQPFRTWRWPGKASPPQKQALAKLEELAKTAFEKSQNPEAPTVDYFPGSSQLLKKLQSEWDLTTKTDVRVKLLLMALWRGVRQEVFSQINDSKYGVVRPIDWLHGDEADLELLLADVKAWYREPDRLRFVEWLERALLRHARKVLESFADVPSTGAVSLDEPIKTTEGGKMSRYDAVEGGGSADDWTDDEVTARAWEALFDRLLASEMAAAGSGAERRAVYHHLMTLRDWWLEGRHDRSKPGPFSLATEEGKKKEEAMGKRFRDDLKSPEVRRFVLGDPEGATEHARAGLWKMAKRIEKKQDEISRRGRARD